MPTFWVWDVLFYKWQQQKRLLAVLQSSPNITNLTGKLCVETEHLPAWRTAGINIRPCCLLVAVSAQKQQCSQGADQGPQNRIVLYTKFSWLQIRDGFCYTHVTRCLAAKWPISLWTQASTFPQSSTQLRQLEWRGRCLLDRFAREQPIAGPLASAKAMVSGVGALFFSRKATLSSLTASIPTTASYLSHASSCTHQPLKPSLWHLPLAQNTKPCLSRCRQSAELELKHMLKYTD